MPVNGSASEFTVGQTESVSDEVVRGEPPPTRWNLPDPESADDHGIVAVGADLEPGTLLAAYRRGLFPMRISDGSDSPGLLAWWSPEPRGVLPLDAVHLSRSLRRSMSRFEFRVDTAFEDVMRRCADPRRPHGWIDDSFIAAYTELHRLGWAHSFEAWLEGELVGGVYGIAIDRFFAGESMFYRVNDASKVALVRGVAWLRDHGFELFDVQWTTDHLRTLGAVEIGRREYLQRLHIALR